MKRLARALAALLLAGSVLAGSPLAGSPLTGSPLTGAPAAAATLSAGGSPIGAVDLVTPGLGSIRIHGWMLDPDTAGSGRVAIYVDSRGYSVAADRWRTDVARRFPNYGPWHGFERRVYARPGSHRVCVVAKNLAGPGAARLLGCRTVTVLGSPGGRLDGVTVSRRTIQAGGWAIDPDTAAATQVRVDVDGQIVVTTTADLARPDVWRAFAPYGSNHGFTASVPATPGRHTVCGYALNAAGSGATTRLGCAVADVPTFDDEFDAPALDPTKWWIGETAVHGFRSGDECYVRSGVKVADGLLQLTATKLAAPQDCAGFATPYQSGIILTKGRFAQTYGRFEMRAKFPPGLGFQPAFWLLPENPARDNGAQSYGEIDVVEAWGNQPGVVSPHLHYVTTPGNVVSGTYCPLPTSATQFHTYAVEWSPARVTFRYDGWTCWSTTWEPLPQYSVPGAVAPAPLDQPFYLIVQLAMGGDSTPENRADASTPFPSTMYVDYVRVWSL